MDNSLCTRQCASLPTSAISFNPYKGRMRRLHRYLYFVDVMIEAYSSAGAWI